MKKKQIFLATLVAVIAFTPLISAQADEKGYWTYYEYTRDILRGDGVNSRTSHSSAQDAYAVVIYSSGKYSMAYVWDKPILDVCISNDDTQTISVTWREYFYEN